MAYGNVTVPALSFARPVAKPEIKEILDLETGECVEVTELISDQLYQNLVDARGKILERMNTDHPKYVCAMCGVAVYLVSTSEKRFFFRHRVENGSCPAQTRSPLTLEEICARKYHGLRESEPHHRIKELIERSLLTDESFSDVAIERTWRATDNATKYRRPDVQATFRGQKLAIEVQLSTTFLSVVVGRRTFYRDEGALLLWVFGSFDPSYRRLTTDDLLFSNNSNVFVISEETAERSIEERQFVLKCHYRRPVRRGSDVADEWAEEVVPFADLAQDLDGQRIYFFDYEGAERELRAQIAQEAIDREEQRDRDLRDAFSTFWCSMNSITSWAKSHDSWTELREVLSRRELILPVYSNDDQELCAMLNAILSAREGRSIGWKFSDLTQVGHHLHVVYPRQLLAFGYALRQYGRSNQIQTEDRSGKWAKKKEGIASRLRHFDPALMPEARLLPLMNFLFPEVAAQVSAYLDRAPDQAAS